MCARINGWLEKVALKLVVVINEPADGAAFGLLETLRNYELQLRIDGRFDEAVRINAEVTKLECRQQGALGCLKSILAQC